MNQDNTFERVNYFQGQLLTVSDLKAEQEYLLAKHRRHNRYLHGWGVASGLKVTIANTSEVVVEPGVAIDCAGNEIHVCTQVQLKVPMKLDEFFVTLQYTETETSPIPNPSGSTSEELTYTRIKEGFALDIMATDPASGHRGIGTGTPGCGCLHSMCIARFKKGRQGWKIEEKGRRRS
ncbi:hypothetical protein [Sulfurirhabdus autotrophica]|uniref:Uncharacterized protein n=1 Tax=Sulfurirhabdus autotrophica TaxID=1706046 RepID=A0A4R3Y6F7_9PROT|nr:hypothetical protein [Sulfurirhabdus autotrophica]TCV86448.1 hypothetical protein EDC63_107138 [Sulfurirhabdus autotrophica]